MMNKHSTWPKQGLYLLTNQTCQNKERRGEKDGVPSREVEEKEEEDEEKKRERRKRGYGGSGSGNARRMRSNDGKKKTNGGKRQLQVGFLRNLTPCQYCSTH